MDHLLRHFQLLNKPSTPDEIVSPLDTLSQLCTTFPREISGVVNDLGTDKDSETHLYSATITIEKGETFLVTGDNQEKAIEAVVQQAYEYLVEEAKKRLTTATPPVKPVSFAIFEGNDNETGVLSFEQIEETLKLHGYTIKQRTDTTVDMDSFDIIYICTMDIPGLSWAPFIGESLQSPSDATKEAARQLEKFCQTYLALNKLSVCPNKDDNGIKASERDSPTVEDDDDDKESSFSSLNDDQQKANETLEEVGDTFSDISEHNQGKSEDSLPKVTPEPELCINSSIYNLTLADLKDFDQFLKILPASKSPATKTANQNDDSLGFSRNSDIGNLTIIESAEQMDKLLPSKSTPALSLQDQQILAILNCFNRVYDPETNPLSLIIEVFHNFPTLYSLDTIRTADSKLYQTVLKVANRTTITETDRNDQISLENALLMYFDNLVNVSKFFVLFKSVYSPSKSADDIFDELILHNKKGLLRLSSNEDDGPGGPRLYRTTIAIVNFLTVTQIGPTRAGSLSRATARMIELLHLYANQVQVSLYIEFPPPPQADEEDEMQSGSSRMSRSPGPRRGNQQASIGGQHEATQHPAVRRRVCTRGRRGGAPSSSSPTAIKKRDATRIELVNAFNSVFNPSKTSIEVMEELLHRYPAMFDFSSVYEAAANVYRVCLRIPRFHIESTSSSVAENAREKVLGKAFIVLYKVSYLLATFRNLTSSSDIEELLLTPELGFVKVSSLPNGFTTMTLVLSHLTSFTMPCTPTMDRNHAKWMLIERAVTFLRSLLPHVVDSTFRLQLH